MKVTNADLDESPQSTTRLPLPPVAVRAPNGRRVLLAVDSGDETPTIGDVAEALGLDRRAQVTVDGRPADRCSPAADGGLRHGSIVAATCRDGFGDRRRLTARGAAEPGTSPGAATVIVAVEAGPAAGRRFALGPGRHVIGRASSADVTIDDADIELHHAVIEVGAAPDHTASATLGVVRQLAGRVPWRWLEPAASGDFDPGEGEAFGPGAVALLGSSRLRFGAGPGVPPTAVTLAPSGDPWHDVMYRPPRVVPVWDPPALDAPTSDRRPARVSAGLVASLLSAAGGGTIAVVTHNPMFVLFGLVGLGTALGVRLVGRFSNRKHDRVRRRRDCEQRDRFVAELDAQRARRLDFHRCVAPTLVDSIAAIDHRTSELWQRRSTHPDVFAATLGWGPIEWEPRVAWAAGSDDATSGVEIAAAVTAAGRVADAPTPLDLGSAATVAIVGDHRDAVARSLLVQMAAFTGPADWRLVVVSDRPSTWEWSAWLPHAVFDGPIMVDDTVDGPVGGRDRLAAALTRLDDGDGRHVVLVIDRVELLATRTGPVRRFIGARDSIAVLAVVAAGASVPAMCRSVLEIGSLGQARWTTDTAAATHSTPVHVAGLSLADADSAARRLAPLTDPEDPDGTTGSLPPSLSIGELLHRVDRIDIDDPTTVATRWHSGAGRGNPSAVIGVVGDGVIEIDLVRDGPHALVAGTTGSGKSELLRTLVVSLAARCSPDDLTFVLIDYKGGSTFDACAHLPHTVGVVTDLDDHLAARALASLDAEVRRRERLLRGVGVPDIDAYRKVSEVIRHADPDSSVAPLPRLVVVIDEFATLATELPGFLDALVGVAQRGRSLGLHLVLATQRPAGVVSDDIRANTNLRIALRLQDRTDAIDVVADAAPATFARGLPGRAMLRLGPGEGVVFQTASSSIRWSAATGKVTVSEPGRGARSADKGPNGSVEIEGSPTIDDSSEIAGSEVSELTTLVRSVRSAASLCGIAEPFRPWLDPLPEVIGPADLAELVDGADGADGANVRADGAGFGVVGIVDDPGRQCRSMLRWDARGGNLALIGALGSGTTTALQSVVAAQVAAGLIEHVYVLDARGDGALAGLADLAWCGGVIGRHDREQRGRMLRVLADEIARRQSRPAGGDAARVSTPTLLAVDGLAGLLHAVSAPGDADEHDALLRILVDGTAVGIGCVATLERPGAVPPSVLAAFAERWLFRIDDPAEAAIVGVRPAHVPPPVPGRIVVTTSRLVAQVALPQLIERPAGGERSGPADRAAGRVPTAVEVLPESVAASSLPPSTWSESGVTTIQLGREFSTLGPATLDLVDGEHCIVLGPARSGRSTTLATIAAGWCEAHPDAAVWVLAPRAQSPALAWARQRLADGHGVVVAADEESLASAVESSVGSAPRLVIVDDAERLDDPGQGLLNLALTRDTDLAIIAAARPDALRTMYGHWTAVVRRSRVGLVMAAAHDTDGELLGETLPRRLPIAARPGLGWLVDLQGRRLVQVAQT